jgi:hypothetical protein
MRGGEHIAAAYFFASRNVWKFFCAGPLAKSKVSV